MKIMVCFSFFFFSPSTFFFIDYLLSFILFQIEVGPAVSSWSKWRVMKFNSKATCEKMWLWCNKYETAAKYNDF